MRRIPPLVGYAVAKDDPPRRTAADRWAFLSTVFVQKYLQKATLNLFHR
jgi:hypothetical protein